MGGFSLFPQVLPGLLNIFRIVCLYIKRLGSAVESVINECGAKVEEIIRDKKMEEHKIPSITRLVEDTGMGSARHLDGFKMKIRF